MLFSVRPAWELKMALSRALAERRLFRVQAAEFGANGFNVGKQGVALELETLEHLQNLGSDLHSVWICFTIATCMS